VRAETPRRPRKGIHLASLALGEIDRVDPRMGGMCSDRSGERLVSHLAGLERISIDPAGAVSREPLIVPAPRHDSGSLRASVPKLPAVAACLNPFRYKGFEVPVPTCPPVRHARARLPPACKGGGNGSLGTKHLLARTFRSAGHRASAASGPRQPPRAKPVRCRRPRYLRMPERSLRSGAPASMLSSDLTGILR
jgi:hypothetical protein